MYDAPNHAAPITPSDTAPLAAATTWLAFANSGTQTLTITTIGGEKVALTLPGGMYPIRAQQVWSTGTSVTAIVGFWT